MFQSSAYPKAGRNISSMVAYVSVTSFNPRPTRKQAVTLRLFISQSPAWFQSSAYPKAGRNRYRPSGTTPFPLFQSSAYPKAGRNIPIRTPLVNQISFNPRPTRKQAVTTLALRPATPLDMFQSSAYPKAGRNHARIHHHCLPMRFNPRPTRKQAVTAGRAAASRAFRFQSSAYPKAGRNRQRFHRPGIAATVSILGLPESRP